MKVRRGIRCGWIGVAGVSLLGLTGQGCGKKRDISLYLYQSGKHKLRKEQVMGKFGKCINAFSCK